MAAGMRKRRFWGSCKIFGTICVAIASSEIAGTESVHGFQPCLVFMLSLAELVSLQVQLKPSALDG